MREVVISILTHNKLDYTKRCLDKLFENTILPYHRVVITDNNSSDGTQKWLKSLDNRIRLIENSENTGFARAHNSVIETYPCHDVVLMNNDIEVPLNWLTILQEKLYINNYGAASPAIKVQNGLDVGAVLDGQAKGRSLINDDSEPDWITGSCIYLKNTTIQQIGLLDESYMFYYEDVDYCRRMKEAKVAFKCIKDVVIVHHNSVSSNPEQKRQMMEESRKYFISKYPFAYHL